MIDKNDFTQVNFEIINDYFEALVVGNVISNEMSSNKNFTLELSRLACQTL